LGRFDDIARPAPGWIRLKARAVSEALEIGEVYREGVFDGCPLKINF
jgi:hypothetical protein